MMRNRICIIIEGVVYKGLCGRVDFRDLIKLMDVCMGMMLIVQ